MSIKNIFLSLKIKSTKNILLFVFICLLELALAIGGGMIIGRSLITIWFELSVISLIVGVSFLYWVPIYQRSRYIKILRNKYNEVQGNKENDGISANTSAKKIKKGFFLKKHAISTQAKLFFGLFFLAVVLALIPLGEWENRLFNWVYNILNALRTAMQFFTVNGDMKDIILKGGGISSVDFYCCYVLLLCVVAGILFAYNIVIIFAKEFYSYMDYWVVHPFSAIYVMSELNERSVTLAESIMLKHQNSRNERSSTMSYNPRFYFCDTNQKDNQAAFKLISRAWQLDATILKRDITELKIKLGAKSNTFYFIGKDEEENVNKVKQISEAYRRKDIKKKLRIYIYASRTESEMIIDDINEQFYNIVKEEGKKDYPLTIRRIDEHYRFALDFFWEQGEKFFDSLKSTAVDNKIKIFRVGFIGFGEYAYELLKTLCALGQLPGCRLIVYIFDKAAENKKAKFQQELLNNCFNNSEKVYKISDRIVEANEEQLARIMYHDYPFYELHFIKCDVEKNAVINSCADKKFTHMFFLLGNDKLNIDMATKISVAYSRQGLKMKLYAMVKNDETVVQLRRKNGTFSKHYPDITLIGTNCERYAYESIAEDRIEEVAKQVHKNYCINKIFAGLYDDVDKYSANLSDNIYGENIKPFKQQLYKMKDDILRKWRENPEIRSDEINQIIQNKQYSEITQALNLLACNCTNQAERDSIQSVINIIKSLKDKLNKVWDARVLDMEFYKEEYFRRSSKARALFEKLLFDLGYLCVKNNNIIICKNVVSEYVEDRDWNLNSDPQKRYYPQNIPFYLVLERKSKMFTSDYDKNFADYLHNTNYKNFAHYMVGTEHINSQWFEMNNIFQKRWMVFRWGEGYQKCSVINEDNNPRNKSTKTHAYIIPYVEIYMDDYKRFRHTVYVYLPKEQDRKRLGYTISEQ